MARAFSAPGPCCAMRLRPVSAPLPQSPCRGLRRWATPGDLPAQDRLSLPAFARAPEGCGLAARAARTLTGKLPCVWRVATVEQSGLANTRPHRFSGYWQASRTAPTQHAWPDQDRPDQGWPDQECPDREWPGPACIRRRRCKAMAQCRASAQQRRLAGLRHHARVQGSCLPRRMAPPSTTGSVMTKGVQP